MAQRLTLYTIHDNEEFKNLTSQRVLEIISKHGLDVAIFCTETIPVDRRRLPKFTFPVFDSEAPKLWQRVGTIHGDVPLWASFLPQGYRLRALPADTDEQSLLSCARGIIADVLEVVGPHRIWMPVPPLLRHGRIGLVPSSISLPR